MVQPQQVIDVSAAAPAVVPENAAGASDSGPEAQAPSSTAPQLKPLLRTVVTRARRSGLRVALGVIFFFGFASLVLTARSTSFSRAWHSSFSSVRSSGASILRSTTRTVVPVLVHRDQDDQLDSNATDDESIASASATAASSHVNALPVTAAAAAPVKKLELRSIDTDTASVASVTAASPTFALLRVIGNALPPRHDPARTLQNLRFILEHEQLEDASDLAKHYVINRIIDSALASEIKALLQEFNASFTEIPFDLGAYAHVPYRVVIEDNGVDSVHAAPADDDDDDEDEGEWIRTQNQNEIMDAKNRYAFSVNAARNVMIEIGQRLGARWILPWDQNCFLTRDAWRRIKTDLTYQDKVTAAAVAAKSSSNQDDVPIHELKYFLTPMERLVEENDVVLSPDYTPYPWEEPQLIFRSDALERFDERFRYGKRDKVALLVRLRVPGVWTEWGWSTWELERTFKNISRDIDNVTVPQTGYVVRLYSGVPGLDTDDGAAAYFRELTRGKAVVQMLETLDDRVMREVVGFRPETLTVYNASALEAMQRVYKARGSRGALEQLMHDAAKALVARHARALWTITSNAPVAALDHAANVFATDIDAQDVFDDGHVLQDFVYNTTALTLAWQLTGEARFANLAIAALDAWCVNASTAMEPLLDFADVASGGNITDASSVGAASGIRHTAGLPYLLDAVRLLFYPQQASRSSSSSNSATVLAPATVPDATRAGVLAWVERLYTYFQTAEHPRRTFRAAPSLFGLQYDLQVAALAAFLNDSRAYRYTLGTLQGRLMTMVDAGSGKLLVPIGVAETPYVLLSLATWGSALNVAQQLNMTTHLLQFDLTPDGKEEATSADGGLLCRVVAAHIPCCHDAPTDSGACVAMLQDAAPVHLFIYQRLVHHAVQTCTRLAALPTCTSVASLTLALDELSSHELRRYGLAPYSYLV